MGKTKCKRTSAPLKVIIVLADGTEIPAEEIRRKKMKLKLAPEAEERLTEALVAFFRKDMEREEAKRRCMGIA